MIPGYDCVRPRAENYTSFEREFITGLSRLDLEGLSLMLFGSYVRRDYDPGRSDIDGILIFPDDVVINKKNLLACGHVLAEAQQENHIPLQITVTDLSTARDGRMSTLTGSFEDYLAREAKIVLGKDYRTQISYKDHKPEVMDNLSIKLKRSRKGVLHAEDNSKEDLRDLITAFNQGIDAAITSTKQLAYLIEGSLREKKFDSLGLMRELFPEVDILVLEKIQDLYQHPAKLDRLYRTPEQMIKLMVASLEVFEHLVREYLKDF